ncbi:MAG: HAD hydrolase-like protein [Chlamydiales bacterium]|nr:HAD hydrolase-like protein [Chlamydiales bacterium]
MLIIFDLDDTLIDTTGSVIPFKMKLCLERLVELGLKVSSFERAYQELMAINAVSLRSFDAIKQFINLKEGDLSWTEQISPLMVSPLPDDFVIPTTPGANEVLFDLQKGHHLALVTGGNPSFQREKLEKAGIEPSFFSNILIPEDCIKRPSYEVLCNQFLNAQVVVCGDRVAMDLVPGYELGCMTVHMRWGRGLVSQAESWIDYSISDLRELKDLFRI